MLLPTLLKAAVSLSYVVNGEVNKSKLNNADFKRKIVNDVTVISVVLRSEVNSDHVWCDRGKGYFGTKTSLLCTANFYKISASDLINPYNRFRCELYLVCGIIFYY